MAITGNYTFRGLNVPNVYVQARGFIFLTKTTVQCTALVWLSANDAHTDCIQPLEITGCAFELASVDDPIYPAAYAALKTLPQFAGYADC